MTTLLLAEPTAVMVAGSAPAGFNPAQQRALQRIQAARAARTQLAPLDPDYLHAEHCWEQSRRWNGEDR